MSMWIPENGERVEVLKGAKVWKQVWYRSKRGATWPTDLRTEWNAPRPYVVKVRVVQPYADDMDYAEVSWLSSKREENSTLLKNVRPAPTDTQRLAEVPLNKGGSD